MNRNRKIGMGICDNVLPTPQGVLIFILTLYQKRKKKAFVAKTKKKHQHQLHNERALKHTCMHGKHAVLYASSSWTSSSSSCSSTLSTLISLESVPSTEGVGAGSAGFSPSPFGGKSGDSASALPPFNSRFMFASAFAIFSFV